MKAARRNLNIPQAIRRVIEMEAQALRRARDAVNGDYTRAVRLLVGCRGKVIVTGTGKSGLIAQKVASTLASTGTPAIYMHPTGGMHGELGLVQRRDLILAFGKSGESDELNGTLPALKKIGVRLIAVTANPRSTLARSANVVLWIPIEEEACPLNLSPTCSTTAALAVGDALAITLMKIRGLKSEHIALLHPAGRLGRRLTITVADIMRSGADNPKIPLTASVSDMLIEMTRKHTGAVSVVDRRGRFVGLVTDYDVRRHLERGGDILRKSIREIMNAKATTITPDALAAQAVDLMTQRRKPFLVLPVQDQKGRSVGMIHMHDLRTKGL